ncbi:hypothetical protein MKK63_06710, partial [Methylobacterium sp. J-088]|uniref:hypothetical protein n=1 Tax=Methylobacterium sp. J-088 TaxID=2836664 RepID=UPI001FBBC0D2
WDAAAVRINVLNVTVTVTGHGCGAGFNFSPHAPTDRIAKLAPVTFEPAAICALFDVERADQFQAAVAE